MTRRPNFVSRQAWAIGVSAGVFVAAVGVLAVGVVDRSWPRIVAAEPTVVDGSDWRLEQITLADGKTLSGLIEPLDAAHIEFVSIHRPMGKPMYLIVTPIERSVISTWQRLPDAEHEELRERVRQFRGRLQIEGRRMEDLTLTGITIGAASGWQYRNDWLILESTAEETMTRRAIVRVEQMFTAFRRMLPPRAAVQQRPLRILLFGTTDEYKTHVRSLGLGISNPAFYSAEANIVVAGTEFNRFAEELNRHSRQHRAAKREWDELAATLPERLKQLGVDLQAAGLDKEQRRSIMTLEQKKWDDQRKSLERRIARAERRNAGMFDELSRQMFSRLYHEAFHAYLENHVYSRTASDVPRWLNEGLAQVFESAQLDGDTLRIDAPDMASLGKLVADLRSGSPLSLEELLSTDAATFLVEHRRHPQDASRWYYYAWGVAYYLTFERRLLGTEAFEEYVSLSTGDRSPTARFESFADESLPQFERKWREAMLQAGELWRADKVEPSS